MLKGSDLRKYPKLTKIVGVQGNDEVTSSSMLVDKIERHVAGLATLFASIDIDKDGKLSLVEFARRAPRLMVYFPYLDLNSDGSVTFNELLSSRIFFRFGDSANHSKSAQQSETGSFVVGNFSLLGGAKHDEQSLPVETPMSALEEFEAVESERLRAFFSADRHKDDPVVVEPVIVTGTRWSDGSSGSGFYAVYGLWVDNQLAFDVGAPDEATPAELTACIDAAFEITKVMLRSCSSLAHPAAIRACAAAAQAFYWAQVTICIASRP